MSIETEDQDQPASTNLGTKTPNEEEMIDSGEISLEDDWAAALAEQDQAESATSSIEPTAIAVEEESVTPISPQDTAPEEPSIAEDDLENEWAAALAEQDQVDTASAATDQPAAATTTVDQLESTPSAQAQVDTQEETPAAEATLEDEWAAALAEQDEVETASASTETSPSEQPPVEPVSQSQSETGPTVETEEPLSSDASLADDWAEALAEQDQAESAMSANEHTPSTNTIDEEESVQSAPQDAIPEEPPSSEADLENEWAEALAEQDQVDTSSASDQQKAAITTDDKEDLVPPAPPQAEAQEETPATEAALEDEWAAALAEQDQLETVQDQDTLITSTENAEAQAASPSSAIAETTNSALDDDEDLENDWADVLDDQSQASTTDKPEKSKVATEKETSPEQSLSSSDITTNELQALDPKTTAGAETPNTKGQHTETSPTNIEPTSDDSDHVVMNWPGGDSSQTQSDPQAAKWKPTRVTPDSEQAASSTTPSPEELLAASAASSADQETTQPSDHEEDTNTEPPPELALAAIAAQATVEAAMEGADDVAAIMQDEQGREKQALAESETRGSEETPQPSEAPANTSQPAASTETQELDPAPPNPQPPIPDTSTPNAGEAPDRFRRPFFTGTGGSLFGMFTMNTLLTLLTFGVYSFWGRIKIRRYLHSQTKFAGARLAFHGTGGELFKGWMKAMAIFGIPYTALNYAGALQTNAAYQWGVNLIAGLLILCFIPIAIVGSHRYRMSRTSWRGIYFSFRHSAKDFLALYLKGTLFSILTLGIYYPIFDNAKRTFLSSGTHFGNRAFGFTGEGKELGTIYFKAFRVLVLGIVTAEAVLLATSFLSGKTNPNQAIDLVFWTTVGIVSMVIPFVLGVWFWFQAARQRYMWSQTTFGSARFQATMTGRDVFELKITNLCLLVFSLGLAWPWVQTRNLQFLYYHVGLQGSMNLKQVVQDASTASPMGEELAGFFDTGFDLG